MLEDLCSLPSPTPICLMAAELQPTSTMTLGSSIQEVLWPPGVHSLPLHLLYDIGQYDLPQDGTQGFGFYPPK